MIMGNENGVENNTNSSFERHAQTVLVAIVTLIIGWTGFAILEIKAQQSDMAAEQRILGIHLETIKEKLINNATDQSKTLQRQEEYLDTMWPRLRAHDQNIVTLHRAMEKQCQCVIILEEPERF